MKKTILLLITIFISPLLQAQCAMCKAVVETGGQDLAEAVNSGITYLMVFPYVLVALLAYFMYRYKKQLKN